jgi:hypothetical protein
MALVKSRAERLLDRQSHAPAHWYVPGYYRDAAGHSRAKQVLQDDANAVYELALCWRSCRQTALPLNTMDRNNNWGNWGLVLVLACARYLDDDQLLDLGQQRWKELLDRQIDDRGHLPHEVRRDGGRRGIWYSHFSLFPQTIAAEILRVAGRDLYRWRSPQGRTLHQAFVPLAGWTRDPASFPYWGDDPNRLTGVTYFSYFEILNAHWPNEHATPMLQDARPMTARHCTPVLTFTHGELLED